MKNRKVQAIKGGHGKQNDAATKVDEKKLQAQSPVDKQTNNQKRTKKKKNQNKNKNAKGTKAPIKKTISRSGSALFALSTFQISPHAHRLPMPAFDSICFDCPPSPDASQLPLPKFSGSCMWASSKSLSSAVLCQ